MYIFNLKKDVKEYIYTKKLENKSIGFVPTMGALHKGHLSLIEKSKNENEITVVSIFVNPTQFDNPDDLEKYPNTIEKDTVLLDKHGVDLIFLPTANEVYGDNIIAEEYDFGNLDKVMEGKHRIGHFDGVATIVKLLFDIVQPTSAYFGEKDFQQLQIIKKMVEIKKLSVNIVPCPIVREEDGLAMSSRNVRLSSEHRIKAPFIHQKMKEAAKLSKTKSVSEIYDYINECFANNNLLQLEYFEIRDEKTLSKVTDFQDDNDYMAFVAVFAQNIRLIDNIKLF